MFLQGNLQVLFDALYTVGAIDPVLKMDWNKITDEMSREPTAVSDAIDNLNDCRGDFKKMVSLLTKMEPKVVNFVALEVAREFCEFTQRQHLH